MAFSKVILNGTTLMDVTGDTVTAGSMLSGTTATKNDGTSVTGNIATKTSSDMTVSGATVTAPAGYYSSSASKAVASGSVTMPASIDGGNTSISISSGKITLSKSVSATPSVTTAGYVSSGTAGNTTISLSATAASLGATTYTPATSQQTIINAGTYVYGTQKIDAMPTGTAGTPTATKGTVSNHSVSITPSVTNTTGYITGSTKTGTAVTVSASELVSGSQTITENDTYDVTNLESITVDVSGGGGGGDTNPTASSNDVNFIDYDGTIRYSYSASDFANLSALPANPTHSGLTSQGWNWSLSDAKTYVSDYGQLTIGQMYVTDDGKTRIYIHLEEGRLSPMLGCCPNGTVVVDWGDGTSTETLTGTNSTTVKWTSVHNYAQAGDYVITLTVTSGTIYLYGSSNADEYAYILRYSSGSDTRNTVYQNAIKYVELGTNIQLSSYALHHCAGLKAITIPSNLNTFGADALSYCYELTSITIPPRSGQTISNYAFRYCYGLSSVSLPGSGTLSINSGVFQYCYGLSSITFPSKVVTGIGGNTFRYSGLTSFTTYIGGTSIGNYGFSNCYSLSNVTIPTIVSSIGSYAFYYCYGLGEIYFTKTTPPTVSNSNAFTGVPTDCKIYVPYSALAGYVTGTNYPNPTTFTYIGYATYTSGTTLPTQDSTQAYNVTWYASKADAIAQTNAITQGNGNEIYCRYTAV